MLKYLIPMTAEVEILLNLDMGILEECVREAKGIWLESGEDVVLLDHSMRVIWQGVTLDVHTPETAAHIPFYS